MPFEFVWHFLITEKKQGTLQCVQHALYYLVLLFTLHNYEGLLYAVFFSEPHLYKVI